MAQVVKGLYAAEGVPGFYRGFHFNCARMVFFNIVMFLTYENVKKAVKDAVAPSASD